MAPIEPLTDQQVDQLLQSTSRTFALSIPLLPPAERREVGLAYLVFRIADTYEDAELLGRAARIAGLQSFEACFETPSPAQWSEFAQQSLRQPPSENADYNRLVAATPQVLCSLAACRHDAGEIVTRYATASIHGMIQSLQSGDTQGVLQFQSIDQLRRYCYFVAGVVGEMLTELFLLRLDDKQAAGTLLPLARDFGEGLQLVNILKDSRDDATQGRCYLPGDWSREAIMELARGDLRRAAAYVDALRSLGAPDGYIEFSQLPLELAEATLDRLATHGPGAKVSRDQVAAIMAKLGSRSTSTADIRS
jgi:farnesyl-diphosphate farnesyltransferase